MFIQCNQLLTGDLVALKSVFNDFTNRQSMQFQSTKIEWGTSKTQVNDNGIFETCLDLLVYNSQKVQLSKAHSAIYR